ncbi:MAG: hypothetical protein IPP29_04125 [Bacteroidetes bacterium]|nr:hypothetical protein [Bacteroidota bacterium]
MTVKSLLIFLVMAMSFNIANAQTNPFPVKIPYQQTTHIMFAIANTNLCGCDGKTYRNPKLALYAYHVNYYENGPCLGADFDIQPTLFAYDLTLDLYVKSKAPVRIFISNLFGTVVYEQFLNSVDRFRINLQTESWQYGVYAITVVVFDGNLTKAEAQQTKKLVKTYTE